MIGHAKRQCLIFVRRIHRYNQFEFRKLNISNILNLILINLNEAIFGFSS
jgi:hypothetical protein